MIGCLIDWQKVQNSKMNRGGAGSQSLFHEANENPPAIKKEEIVLLLSEEKVDSCACCCQMAKKAGSLLLEIPSKILLFANTHCSNDIVLDQPSILH